MAFSNKINNTGINLSNYEEYFLLYVDNELSPDQRKAVELFVAEHPQLQNELDILLSTKLPAETVGIENKEHLLAESMKLSTIDEALLLYIDNELTEEEQKKVKQRLLSDYEYQGQYQQLLKAKFSANDAIAYPYKKELYGKISTVQPVFLMRVAAALIIVLSLGAILLLNNNKKQPPVAVQSSPKKIQPSETIMRKEIEVLSEKQLKTNSNIALQTKKKVTSVPENKSNIKRNPVQKPNIAKEDVTDRAVAKNETINPIITTPKSYAEVPQEKNNKQPVTSDVAVTYTNTEGAANNTMVSALSVSDNKKGSVRGFLRKATRFIERRTGVNPVNDDDELLIGAIAIKLK
ncbi:MAG: hypothetical protein ABR502_01415 [Chitinophagaceae bacterium]